MLLDYGADVQVVDHLGSNKWESAIVRFSWNSRTNERLPLERWYNDSSTYCPLGGPVGSLLHIAAYGAPLETIQLLLENEADPLAEGNSNALPFRSACQAGRIDALSSSEQGSYARESVIDLLRTHGADTEVIRDSEGRFVKDWAIEQGCVYDWDKQVVRSE
ncbi:hypothetical protein IFM47457_07488 [Aspergillus lentulus]|nr:hypothetical protein IFM47457_07488 [Aspergillus lentulus]